MSFLTPLYILGALAIAGPILFHLIRRAPRGEVPFSSLMFLAPSPPRLTRRSRLDNLLLLLLRAAVLVLLALAFARPFLRRAMRIDFGDGGQERVAVLVDASASMRRGDLWKRAVAIADQTVARCRPADQLAVLTFDDRVRPALGFEESNALDPGRRRAVASARLARTTPGWGSTRLGQALIDAVAAIDDVRDVSAKAARVRRRVVLISDLQQGSRLEALGDYEWPSDVELEIKTLTDNGANAGLQRLPDPVEGTPDAGRSDVRVRVANDPEARREAFELHWTDAKGATVGRPLAVYVPPGESRVVRVHRPQAPARSSGLRLTGDTQVFDNTLFFVAETKDTATVVYVGGDAADDPAGLRYYLERAVQDTAHRKIRVAAQPPGQAVEPGSDRSTSLVVLSGETTPENANKLREFVRAGGTVLDVLSAAGPAKTLAAIVGVPVFDVDEAHVARDVMLSEIAFDHPLFAPFAGPQYNDFTKIHFWKYRRLDAGSLGEKARVVARFEGGDPAVVETLLGQGRIVVFTSGWNRADSQLARSSKFVPLVATLIEGRAVTAFEGGDYLVHDKIRLPADAKGLTVHKPDGTTSRLAQGMDFFTATDEPGVYTVDTSSGTRSFAVNLDPAESKTAPLGVETLEQFGCRLAKQGARPLDREHLRQLHNAELENRQKLWRGLILAAISVLLVETLIAGRLSRPRAARAEGAAS